MMVRTGEELVAKHSLVSPASKSVCESALYHKELRLHTDLKNLDKVRSSLDADAKSQLRKYGTTEPNPESARFTVALPKGPQHLKFSRGGRPETAQDGQSDASTTATPTHCDVQSPRSAAVSSTPRGSGFARRTLIAQGGGQRFDKHMLMQWFREIDAGDSGYVSRKQFMMALRQRPEFHLAVFGNFDEGAPAEEAHAIAEMLRNIEGDGHGHLSWDDFVQIFRQCDLLFEYTFTKELEEDPYLVNTVRAPQLENKQAADRIECPEALAQEIRHHVGPQEESRFRHRRHVGTPTPEAWASSDNRRGSTAQRRGSAQRLSVQMFEEHDGLFSPMVVGA